MQEIYWIGALGLQGISVILVIYGIVNNIVNKKINGMVDSLKKDVDKRALASDCVLRHDSIDHSFNRINGNLEKIFDKVDEQTKTLSTLVGRLEKR